MLTKDDIIEGIQSLNLDERQEVLDALILSFDETLPEAADAAHAEVWTEEVDRRLGRFRRGETTASSWQDVEAKLDRLLDAEAGTDTSSP